MIFNKIPSSATLHNRSKQLQRGKWLCNDGSVCVCGPGDGGVCVVVLEKWFSVVFLILDYVCAERGGGGDLFSHPSDFETSDFAYEGAGGNRFHINRGKRGGGKSVFTSLRFWNAYETLHSHKIGEVHELVPKRFEFFSAIFKHCFHMVSFLSGTFLRHFFS